MLYHWKGDDDTAAPFQPMRMVMDPGRQKQFDCFEGHPSYSHLPYFNLKFYDGGILLGIVWPAQWPALFARNHATSLRLAAGQELTYFRLHPGEEIRTPLIVLQFDKGDWRRAHNVWRRWMIACNLPRLDSQPLRPMLFGYSGCHTSEMVNTDEQDEQDQKRFIERYLAERLTLDCWWMDAGWYDLGDRKDYAVFGTWLTDKRRFPNGLRTVTDYAHRHNLKTLLWFTPEAVTPGSWLDQHHPEWLLGAKGGTRLLYLGNPKACDWVIRQVDKVMTEEGIDIYRQDQFAPLLGPWRANDAPDRQGITEIRHVEGYLRFWDELGKRHPNMFTDTCAGGGARIDLETLRRAVPLHSSN